MLSMYSGLKFTHPYLNRKKSILIPSQAYRKFIANSAKQNKTTMSSLFVSVLRQAFKTFDRANAATFGANFTLLKQLTDQLTARDIHLGSKHLSDDAFEPAADRAAAAPCSFVHIFENDNVSLSVFVMRGGYTMPLHDHPMMHGLLRGIYGQVCVQSYSQQLAPGEPLVYDRNRREVCVRAEQPRLISPETESCVLTPRERNFHQITALGGVAAFFDILSPPYDADIPVHGVRRCRFYRPSTPLPNVEYPVQEMAHEKGKGEAPLLRLERIPVPSSYYCDNAETPEAVAKCTYICSAEAYSAASST